MNKATYPQLAEANHILGEMAASRLHDLLYLRFEELKESEGLTRLEVARRLDVTEQQLSRWLAEPRNMTVKSAGRLMGALDGYLKFSCEPVQDDISDNCPAVTMSNYLTATTTVTRRVVFTKYMMEAQPQCSVSLATGVKTLPDAADHWQSLQVVGAE